MPSICQHCKEVAFDDEEQVCKSCGIVSESLQLCDEKFVPGAHHTCYQKTQRDAPGLVYGKSVLTTLCTKLNIRKDIREQAMALLIDVHPKYHFYCKDDIAAMATCCLTSVNKKEEAFISFSTMSALSGCPKSSIYKFTRILKSLTGNGPDASSSSEDKQDNAESWYPLVRSTLTSFPVESRDTLVEKTVKLLELASACWVSTGCSRDSFVVAAAYLCWKSMNPRLKKLAMKQFCKQYELSFNSKQTKVNDLTDLLLKLGSKIPAVTEDYVTKDNAHFHLNYILENSETLRNDLIGPDYNPDSIVQREFATFRKPPKKKPKYSSYVPGSFVKKGEAGFKNSSDFSDPEISDSEIDSYIRTEEQVDFIKSLEEENS